MIAAAAAASLGFSLGSWPDEAGAASGSAPFDPQRPRRVIRQFLTETRGSSPAQTPEELRRVDRLLNEAERITATEVSFPSWDRTPGRVEEAWHRATKATWETAWQLKRRRDTNRATWETLHVKLVNSLRDAEDYIDGGGGLGYREAKAFSGAKYQYGLALRRAQENDYRGATVAAQEAITLATVVETGWRSLHSRFDDSSRLRQWRRWAADTVEWSRQTGSPAIVINKMRRQVEVFEAGRRVASFRAELGANGLKEKRHAGDKATPEGRYRVTQVRGPNKTRFYKALLLDYPNAEDLFRFREDQRRGLLPTRVGPGGLIEIHGEGGEGRDWTDGCVALRNSDIDSLFRWSGVGTPVTIVGAL